MIQSVEKVAKLLSIPSEWLYNLIKFESSNNPQARNRYTGARGLIQFLHSTAREMGFQDADDLVKKYPDFDSQLINPVYNYLKKYMPFPTRQSLYMAVFYPAARKWDLYKEFPDTVKKVNPGINTVGDYVRKVDKNFTPVIGSGLIAVILLSIVLFNKYLRG